MSPFYGLTKDLKSNLHVTQNKLISLGLFWTSSPDRKMRILLNLTGYQCLVGWIKLLSVMFLKCIITWHQSTWVNISPLSVMHIHNYITRFRVSVNKSGEPCSDTKRYSLSEMKGFGQKTFAYQGCYLWNSLLQYVRNSKNVPAFKSNAKTTVHL